MIMGTSKLKILEQSGRLETQETVDATAQI